MKRKIINSIYGVTVAIIVVLVGMVIFGQDVIIGHESAFYVSLANRAFFLLMAAAIPMICLGIAVCNCNDINNSKYPKLFKFLIYIPAVICVGCILLTIGIVIYGMVSALLRDFKELQEIDATINSNNLTN